MTSTEFIVRPGTQEVVVTRVFDAPREVVFKAITDPNLIPKWWGPRSQTTIVDKMDLRPGGAWRFIGREPDGKTRMTTKSVYQSIEDRDGMVGAGMETGATESGDRLAELLATI